MHAEARDEEHAEAPEEEHHVDDDGLPARPVRPRPAMSWSGWGDPTEQHGLPHRAERMLRQTLHVKGERRPPVPLADVSVPDSRLDQRVATRLGGIVGSENVRTDRDARIRHAGGKSYPDLVRLRAGDAGHAPDAVVRPGSHDEVDAVLAACAEEGVAVVPFGGGTSVVGGVEALRGGLDAVIALDLARMNRLLAVDTESLTATFEPGLRGIEAEELLNARGLTLGHFPQSVEYATIGGMVATRSAGQASTGYGRIDELVEHLRCATPSGELAVGRPPASAAGPDLLGLLVGSEGTLGVITEVTLRVRRAPAQRRYEGWMLPSFEAGLTVFRELAQSGAAPDVARLSDTDETRVSLTQVEGAKGRVLGAYLRLRRRRGGCLVIVGWEGEADAISHRRRAAVRALRRGGAVRLGTSAGQAWVRSRFAGPYLRDDLMERGVLVETLETAAPWSGVRALHAAVRAALTEALQEEGRPPLVLCHVSHLYAAGASLYFTFLARVERGQEIARWQAAKEAASAAIVGEGATITHHHAVGRDHLAWMPQEVGALGVSVLRAVKDELDPQGLCNPGKLVPAEGQD